MENIFTLLLIENPDKSLISLYSSNTIITDNIDDAQYYIQNFNIDSVIVDLGIHGCSSEYLIKNIRTIYNGVLIVVADNNNISCITEISSLIDDMMLRSDLNLKNMLTLVKRSKERRNYRNLLNDSKQLINSCSV